MVLGLTKVPISSSDIFNLVPPFPVDTFGQLDVMSAVGMAFLHYLLHYCVDMFDNIGTLIGVTKSKLSK